MKQEKVDLNELKEIIEDRLEDFEFVKECDVGHYTTYSKEREFYFYYIKLKGFSNEKSFLGFTYNPDEKRIEHVKGDLKEDLVIYGKFFLNELEKIVYSIGCNEMRAFDNKDFFSEMGWIEYPDGSYRKKLHPWDN